MSHLSTYPGTREMVTVLLPEGTSHTELMALLPEGWIVSGVIVNLDSVRDEKALGNIGYAAGVAIARKVCRDNVSKPGAKP